MQHTGEITADNRIDKIRVFGVPDPQSLNHEPDVTLEWRPDNVRLTFRPGLECEVYGALARYGEGFVEVSPENDTDRV